MTEDEEDKQQEEADKKEAEDDPLKEEVVPSPRVMAEERHAKKNSHAEVPAATPTE